MSAHWTGDPSDPRDDPSVTGWATRIAAMSAARSDATALRYADARLPWMRRLLDAVAAHGTLAALVRAASSRRRSSKRRP